MNVVSKRSQVGGRVRRKQEEKLIKGVRRRSKWEELEEEVK